MITYEEALKKAKELKRDIDHCCEEKHAYVFTSKADEMSIGGSGPCVILKENGRAINMTEYAMNYEYSPIKKYEI